MGPSFIPTLPTYHIFTFSIMKLSLLANSFSFLSEEPPGEHRRTTVHAVNTLCQKSSSFHYQSETWKQTTMSSSSLSPMSFFSSPITTTSTADIPFLPPLNTTMRLDLRTVMKMVHIWWWRLYLCRESSIWTSTPWIIKPCDNYTTLKTLILAAMKATHMWRLERSANLRGLQRLFIVRLEL